MEYIVKSEEPLDMLMNVIKEQKIDIVREPDGLLRVDTKDDEETDIFMNAASYYLTYTYLRRMLFDFIEKGDIKRKEVKKVAESLLLSRDVLNYFDTFTRILVREYMGSMKIINIESFHRFNMKGFHDEAKTLMQRIIQSERETKDAKGSMPPTHPRQVVPQEMFENLRERARINGVDLKELAEIHIHQQGDSLLIKSSKGRIIDDSFFMVSIGGLIRFEVDNVTEDPELLIGALTCSTIIHIFQTKRIVVHKSLTKKARECLSGVVASINGDSGDQVVLSVCHGCDECA